MANFLTAAFLKKILLDFNRLPNSHPLHPFTCALKRMEARNSAVYLGGTVDITNSWRKEASRIYMGLREYTGGREGGAVANNGTHSHSGSTYTFLVASLFSRPKWDTTRCQNSILVFKLLKGWSGYDTLSQMNCIMSSSKNNRWVSNCLDSRQRGYSKSTSLSGDV